jgi:hypothetical protein
LYEGQFVMTNATTSSVWRSTGGDQTRTASAGSMMMSVPFYIANVAVTGNVVASSTDTSTVILPANSVVTAITVSTPATGSIDLGFTPLIGVGPGQNTTLGTKVPQALLANATTTSRVTVATGGTGGGASLGNVANATNLTLVVSTANTGTSGALSGILTYFVSVNETQDV